MSKTQFANGAKVYPAWINSIFGIGAAGGHVHDGVDSDGHAAKISLVNHVDLDINYHSSGNTFTITTDDLTEQEVGGLWWCLVGKLVFVHLAKAMGVSNSVNLVAHLNCLLPTPCQADTMFPVLVYDDNVVKSGMATLNPSGGYTDIYWGLPGTGMSLGHFTASGTKGFPAQSFSYISE
jgi:hypothetical protein